jgi:hypothetical protein
MKMRVLIIFYYSHCNVIYISHYSYYNLVNVPYYYHYDVVDIEKTARRDAINIVLQPTPTILTIKHRVKSCHNEATGQ